MDKKTQFSLLAIVALFVGFITLGAIGNAAVVTPFYWFPFVVNLGVYGFIVYKLFKKGRED